MSTRCGKCGSIVVSGEETCIVCGKQMPAPRAPERKRFIGNVISSSVKRPVDPHIRFVIHPYRGRRDF